MSYFIPLHLKKKEFGNNQHALDFLCAQQNLSVEHAEYLFSYNNRLHRSVPVGTPHAK